MRFRRYVGRVLVVLLAIALISGSVLAQTPSYVIAPDVQNTYQLLLSQEAVKDGLEFIKADHERTVAEQKEICAMPAPPFKEKVRAEDYQKRLAALGLKDVRIDSEGNVLGLRPGSGKGPKLLVTAHLDTVFPEGTDVTVKEKDGVLYAPGIADDARGLAALLSVVRALEKAGIRTVGDLVFCGTVGEEGLGDLRGVKALFRDDPGIDGFISIDGTGATGICYLATGSHRYEITYKGPGGHSFGAFGLPSATHALGRAIAKIADLQVPKVPKTTFTVGTVSGGTSVNAIAAEATMLVDMRSNDEREVLNLESKVLEIARAAASEENARWNSDKMTVNIRLVGDRPAGSQPSDSVVVACAYQAVKALGLAPELEGPSSTDSNVPISLGIPAVTLGGGGKSGRGHSVEEWFDPKDAYLGPQQVFLTVLGLVGVEGVTQPLLPAGTKRPVLLEVNGRLVLTPLAPCRVDSVVMAPLRAVCENLGGKVSWESATGSAVAEVGGRTLKLRPGSEFAVVDGGQFKLPAKVQVVRDRVVVPLEALLFIGVRPQMDDSKQLLSVTLDQRKQ